MKNLYIIAILLPACFPGVLSGQGIYNNAHIIVSGASFITIRDGGFHNKASFVPGTGTVILSGITDPGVSTVGGAGVMPFYHLTIAKTTNGASLSGGIRVDGNLTMQTGNLDLNTYDLDLGSGAGTLLGENNNSRVLGASGGTIIKSAVLNAPDQANPGNLGMVISSSANLGNTVIRRGHQQQRSHGGGIGISRYFDITPANNTSLNASLKMFYLDNELASVPESELNFFKSEDEGNTWTLAGRDDEDATNDWVLKNNIGQLSRWTLASNITSPLPLTLLSFTARLDNGQTRLQWITSSEQSTSYFEVERSTDGANFTGLLTVPAHGFSSTQNTYTATDIVPFPGIDYYRLKEVDQDGQPVYSQVAQVRVDAVNAFSIYPNPVAGILNLNIQSIVPQTDLIGLYDANGKLLYEQEVRLQTGSNLLHWDMSQFARGVYLLQSKKILSVPVKIIKL